MRLIDRFYDADQLGTGFVPKAIFREAMPLLAAELGAAAADADIDALFDG